MSQPGQPLRRLMSFMWSHRLYWIVPLALMILGFLLLAYLARSAGHARLYPL